MKALVGALCGALVIGAASFLAPAQDGHIDLDGTDWFGSIFSQTKINVKPGVSASGSDWMNSMDISSSAITFSASNWGSWSGDIEPHPRGIRYHRFWLNENVTDLESWAANVIGNTTGVSSSLDSAEGSGYVRGKWDLSTILMRSNTRVHGFGIVQGQPRTFKGKVAINGVLFLD